MAKLSFKNIKKVYEGSVTAVENFNLEIQDKEFVVLVGPSGCGKSTVLRMVAGLEEITEGELRIDDAVVNEVEPKDRDLSMVFQNYALFPHMTVYDNIAFGLKRRKEPKHIIDAKVKEAAEILEITELLNRKPKQLSGGQRQRVAIGRAIVRNPKAFLFDEPLSNLDAKLRNQMRAEIISLRNRVNTTFIYVTHDQIEAMTLGDRIVVMNNGHIQQVGTPQEVFDNPENLFVAGFIGTPQMNFMDVVIEKTSSGFDANLNGKKIALPELNLEDYLGKTVVLGIRPEYVEIADSGIETSVVLKELMGSTVQIHTEVDNNRIVVVLPSSKASKMDYGGKVKLSFNADNICLFDKETQNRIK